eukprot:gnl/Trimastix_PCT/1571.p2 GENE.gnl/Trimastix_PCT/1571~~gnl/Trimastix_PCT/1571.p2  ORF type:complete len:159 (-),score=46.85 gnl/Trimastix_PCT/1571:765-1241(-)
MPWSKHMRERWGSANPFWYVDMAQEVSDEGIDLVSHSEIFANTIDAHRMLEFAYEHGGSAIQHQLSEELLRGYYSERQDITRHDVLLDAVARCGLDRTAAQAVLQDRAGRREMHTRCHEIATQYRVRGVPHFVINGRYSLSGAQPPAQFVRAIMHCAR